MTGGIGIAVGVVLAANAVALVGLAIVLHRLGGSPENDGSGAVTVNKE